jgi:hypothetical protein
MGLIMHKHVTKIAVRCEGDGINCNWQFHYCDDSIDSFYAYESSPQYEIDDARVADNDPILYMLLDKLWSDANAYITHNLDIVELEFDNNFNIISKKHFNIDDDGNEYEIVA